ncbi:hypothetical protein PR048_015861 [Dryococelus australis]|uniref:Uncharacterized protein n=1 Tax=Dryococelus australis TaxID=614101 RepID=A0ABQ9HIF4_9NEOP|nr:hypothetical protein PR048_015861 [Dryococelus australis]
MASVYDVHQLIYVELAGSSTTPDTRGCHEPPNTTNKAKLDKVNEFLNALPMYKSYYYRKESSKKCLPPHLTISELHKKYCEIEDKPVSYTIFWKLFSEANIAIKNPKKDICRTCDELKMILMYAGNDEQISLKQQQDMHHNVAELTYQEKKIDMLDNKFMVPGHSRMECDSDYAVTEKVMKYSMQISHPHDWAQLIRMAGKKKPFNVIELT